MNPKFRFEGIQIQGVSGPSLARCLPWPFLLGHREDLDSQFDCVRLPTSPL